MIGLHGLWSLLCLLVATAVHADVTVEFRQGDAGYAGTEDLHIGIPENFNGNGHSGTRFSTDPQNPHWAWDIEDTYGFTVIKVASQATRFGWGDEIGLLRFREIFGTLPGQVPPGAEIVSATLHLHPDNPPYHVGIGHKPGDSANLHEVLLDWDESVRWESFGPAPGPDMGVDYSNPIVAATGSTGSALALDVGSSLQTWSQDPAANRGWAFVPSGVQDTITVSGSSLANINDVTVDLFVDTPARGELVVTLRHGDYTALLVNRLEASCIGNQFGSTQDDINVTFDDSAAEDIHSAGGGAQPLTGTFRPDGACFSLPLCTGGGTGGLCGQPADGDWIITATDEWGASAASLLISWEIHLGDGVNPVESYSQIPLLAIPNRWHGGRQGTTISSSEHSDTSLRPRLEVTYREMVTVAPAAVEALPATGTIDVQVAIPSGANLSGPVTVSVVSDDVGVAQVLNSPLVFPQAGATTLPLQVSVGTAGSALLTFTNDAGLVDPALPIDVGAVPIELGAASLYRGFGDPDQELDVTIPMGSNASSPVSVTLSTSDLAVADLVGGVGGSLTLVFAAGAATTQTATLDFGTAGSATITALDDGAVIGGAAASVSVSGDAPISYDVNLAPYVQLGDAPAMGGMDQIVVVWQTIVGEEQGPDADRFEVEYRKVGDPTWLAAPAAATREVGSTSRVNHAATIVGLDFDAEYEYRVTHLRNGAPLAGGTYQDSVRTRRTDHLYFTAIGNMGNATTTSIAAAQLLALLDPDLHFFNGDNVYFAGEYQNYRPGVGAMFEATMARTPTILVVGNHESITNLGQPLRDHSYVATNGPLAHAEGRTFSFDVGDVHFVVVDTSYSHPTLDTEVAPWLAADLTASTKPWKILVTHELGLTLDPYGIDRQAVPEVQEYVLKVAVENGVNLYIGGANHSFQRYLPITAVHPETPQAPVEWASCTWGAGTTLIHSGGGSWVRSPPGPIPTYLEPPMQTYQLEVGMGTFSISGDTLTASIVDHAGVEIDSVTLDNCQNPANCLCPVCGDGTREDPEECDDGGTVNGDGCSKDCQAEDIRTLVGVAEGGSLSIVVEGVFFSTSTSAGQTPAQALAPLAVAIDAEARLGGIYALVIGDSIVTNGSISVFTVSDWGFHQDFDLIPTLPSWARWVCVGLLLATALGVLGHRAWAAGATRSELADGSASRPGAETAA